MEGPWSLSGSDVKLQVDSVVSKRKKRKGKGKSDEAAEDQLQAVNDEVSIEDVLPSTKMKKLG